MTAQENGLGKRIAYYRKKLGIATARELAMKIDNPKITEAVIQNIESGRKPDPALSQILDIALGIGISPMFLITQFDRPFERIDLANVSQKLGAMTNEELDAWVSGAGRDPLGDSYTATILKLARNDMRKLMTQLEYWTDLTEAIARRDPELTELDAQEQQLMEARIDSLLTTIAKVADVSWVNRPWRQGQQDVDE